jgi:hypothetical protein
VRIVPVVFDWKKLDVCIEGGEVVSLRAMVPQTRYVKVAERQYHEGEEYPLTILETRSRASHNQFFAAVHEAYLNLPENIKNRWENEDHLRKWVLIETGWYTEREHEFATPYAAKNFAAHHDEDYHGEYCRMFHPKKGRKIILRRAKSQSAKAMGKDAFEKSKRDVLDYLGTLTGTTRAQLNENAGRSG